MTSPPEGGIVELPVLLRSMAPELDHNEYVVLTCDAGLDLVELPTLCVFRETEGPTVIVDAADLELAIDLGCRPSDPPRMARITLQVHSSLLAVGLTAAVSGALAADGISCNVVAGFHHDHLFVPVGQAARALELLRHLGD